MCAAATREKRIVRRQAQHVDPLNGLDPTLDLLYRNRGISNLAQLDYSLAKLHPPDRLSNIDDATQIIVEAIEADAQILIAGDFDADGATACALAVLALRAFGARNVGFLCPSRFNFGYGLSKPFVEHITSVIQPDLIITVDNGISNVEGVAAAKQLDITVVVTDHHLPGDELPMADAIVNPNLKGDQFPSKNLAGVGVIFYVLSAVRRKLIQLNWFENEGIAVPVMSSYLDLVALGTVADVVPLDFNNRILVAEGLRRINAEVGRYGVRALLESGSRAIGHIVAEDLAFVAGPRLNASGRMEDISIGIQCLISDDDKEICRQVMQLEELNHKRKTEQQSMFAEAKAEVETFEDKLADDCASVCLFNAGWHQGIIGIIASNIREMTGKPTIVFTESDNGRLKGSGRSIPQVNLRDAIAAVAIIHPHLIEQFGGHAMAAGLTVARESFNDFRAVFEQQIVHMRGGQTWRDEIVSDGEARMIDVDTAEAIRKGGPWGQGFEPPLFDGSFEILEFDVLQERHLKMRVFSKRHKTKSDAIFFSYFDHFDTPPELALVHLIYRLDLNVFRGRRSAQLIVQHMQYIDTAN